MDNRCLRNQKPWTLIPEGGSRGRGKVKMTFRHIPATGEPGFRMGFLGNGYEQPPHRVVLTDDYWLLETPVTQRQYACWKPDHRNHFPNRHENPAESLSWKDAMAFCDWLTTCYQGRFPRGFVRAGLPTEAQWEWACRAGTQTDYWSGTGTGALDAVGWYEERLPAEEVDTRPVRSKGLEAANGFGLWDLHGNVFEWCLDSWDSEAYSHRIDGVLDPLVDEAVGNRVARGGSWAASAAGCRASYRYHWTATDGSREIGFRVCLRRN